MTSQMPVTAAEMLQVTLVGGSGGAVPLALRQRGWVVPGSFAQDEPAAAGTAVHRPPAAREMLGLQPAKSSQGFLFPYFLSGAKADGS